ncbi:uncharacterized protein LOC100392080 isoform X2 [Callithrix jacchus]
MLDPGAGGPLKAMTSQGRLCVHPCPVGHPPSPLGSHSGLGAEDPGPPRRTLRTHSTHDGGLEKDPQRSALPSGHIEACPSFAGSQAASPEGSTLSLRRHSTVTTPTPAGELPSLPDRCKEGAPQTTRLQAPPSSLVKMLKGRGCTEQRRMAQRLGHMSFSANVSS